MDRRVADLATAPQEESPTRLLAILAALGATERTLARSFKWAVTKDKWQRENASPLRGLRPDWLTQIADCVETRLATSLASVRASFGKGKEILWLRQHLEPLKRVERGEHFRPTWTDKSSENDVVWHEGDITDSLNAILARRLVRTKRSGASGWHDWSPRPASLADITAFIERRTNDGLLADLIWGLSLIDWETVIRKERRDRVETIPPAEQERTYDDEHSVVPSAFYALLRLCLRRTGGEDDAIPLVPGIMHRAMSGDGKAASVLAARRLRASGKPPLIRALPVAGDIARRTAAAMLFPISPYDMSKKGPLQKYIIKQPNQ